MAAVKYDFPHPKYAERLAKEYVKKHQAKYAELAKTVTHFLKFHLDDMKKNGFQYHSIQGREKKPGKLISKLLEPHKDDASKAHFPDPFQLNCKTAVPDLAGARVVTYYLDDLPTVYNFIETHFDVVEVVVSLTTKLSDSEDDRRKGIESKASLFISTISVATSIVVAANAMVVSTTNFNISILASVLISFLLSIYAARTVWYAVKALERGNYSVLGVSEINFKGTKEEYQRHLIACLVKNKKNNLKTVNSKVDNVVMAQEYYKRAIIVICIYSCHVLIQCLFKYQF